MIDKFIEMYRQKSSDELQNVIKGGLASFHPDAIKAAKIVIKERGETVSSTEQKGPSSSAPKMKSKRSLFIIFGGFLAIFALVYIVNRGGYSSYGLTDKKVAKSIQIYNEGNENSVSLTINEEAVNILPNSTMYYKLKSGKNVIDMGDTTFTVTNQTKGFLNPAQLPFFFEEIVYVPSGMNEDKVKYQKYPFNIFEIDGAMAIGPYKRDSSYLLSDYDYGPGETFPENIQIRGYGKESHKFKLYDYNEFIRKQNKENPLFQRVHSWKVLGLNRNGERLGNPKYVPFINSQQQYISEKKQKKFKAQMVIVEINKDGKKAFVVAKDNRYQAFINTEGDFFDPENGNGNEDFNGYHWTSLLGYGTTIRKMFTDVDSFTSPEENFTSFHLQDGYGKHSITIENNKLHQIEFEDTVEKSLSYLFNLAIKMTEELKEERVKLEVNAKKYDQVVAEPEVVEEK